MKLHTLMVLEKEAAIRLGNLNSGDCPDTLHRKRRITPVDIRALNSLNAIMPKRRLKHMMYRLRGCLYETDFRCGLSQIIAATKKRYLSQRKPRFIKYGCSVVTEICDCF